MRITSRVIAPVVIVGLGALLITALIILKPQPEKKDDVIRVVSSFVERAETKPLTLIVRTQGEVRPKTEIDLISQVAGRVTGVSGNFVAGGEIQPGVTLLEVDATDYQFAVTNAESRVAEAMANFIRTRADADIVKRQWEDWAEGEPTDLALKKPQIAAATAQLKAAESDLAQARVNLTRTKIQLPFSGRVREKMADIGQVVSPGSKLARVFSTEVVEIKLPLSDSQLAQLNLPLAFQATSDNAPKVTLSAIIAGNLHTWHGRIVRTAAAIDADTRLIYATAEVVDPYGTGMSEGMPLAVGLFVNAAIEGRALDNALVIPRAALRTGNRVYVISKDDTLTIRDVVVLLSEPEQVVIQSGIEPGDMVATSPLKNVVNGMTVAAVSKTVSKAPSGAPLSSNASQ